MAINVVRFEYKDRIQWGVIRSGAIAPITGDFATTAEFIRHVSSADLSARGPDVLEPEAVKILSPVTRNQQFICQGANYRQHMIESGWTRTRRPTT